MGRSGRAKAPGGTRNRLSARSVCLYLEELAGRREQVVENNLQHNIHTIQVAIGLLTEEDLSDKAHLEAYQSRMRKLYDLDKFAFVDTDGVIYTADGIQTNIDDYSFDHKNLSEPEISILNLDSPEKKVVIAVPTDLPFDGKTLRVCFMEIDRIFVSGTFTEILWVKYFLKCAWHYHILLRHP